MTSPPPRPPSEPHEDICAEERIVTNFFEELADKPAEEGRRGSLRMQGAELKRGEREE